MVANSPVWTNTFIWHEIHLTVMQMFEALKVCTINHYEKKKRLY